MSGEALRWQSLSTVFIAHLEIYMLRKSMRLASAWKRRFFAA